ncbi:MAG: response regulator [Bacteroidales bacterium]|nr:response regulator [Bacteroidales bacterium]
MAISILTGIILRFSPFAIVCQISNIDIFMYTLSFVLLTTVIVLLFSLMKRSKINEKIARELTQSNFKLELEEEKLKEVLQRNNDLKEVVESQLNQIKDLRKNIDSIEGKIDEEVLKRTSELHTLLEKTVESNRIKQAFLEKISREIRTPLNSILGFVNLLNDSNLANIDREYYLKFIRESGNNLLTLIENIIDFTKIETKELTIEYKKCNLNVLIADLVDKYRSRLLREKSPVSILFNKPDETVESLADCRRVLLVVDQLINNAIKFTHEGKIEISYSIDNNNHVFIIKDTGIGIDEIHLDIIFERFYQIESETQEYFQGAGLGLTIAKGITDMLGGKIKVKSELGKGSEFTLLIPFKSLNEKNIQSKRIENNYDWKDKTILIAEDEDSNYHFLEALLRKTGAKLLWAPDGIKFLEIVDTNKKNIDLVLLDIKMPGINGINAIKVIRQQNISIPVIAQTAFNQPEDKQRCLDSGCDDYLSKPIDRDLLLSKISKHFN